MRHCLIYHGGFERNFPALKPGTTTYEGTDGGKHTIPPVAAEIDGVCVSYMEKAGKKFAAVRVQRGKSDVVVEHELLLDPGRHLGFGQRFAPEPTIINDDAAATILEDLMVKNPDQRQELAAIRSTFSVTAAKKSKT
ncbi:MAG TPA: hypothetical protein VMH39_02655 [Gemmatimonadaceae bacterium]|nr:hypothetical protein [Gemmatimonadaceae bacterium]